jgi:cell division protein FtsB
MERYSLIVLFVIFSLWYLSYSATRLDRLHHRVETSWANLDGLLQRRAAIAIEIARSEISDPASSLLLTFAAHQAREASIRDRSQAETGLTGALGILIETSTSSTGPIEQDLIRELKELTEKIKMAVAMHVDAVTRTQMVRKKWFMRFFRLAGSAPEPVAYEFEGDVL